MTEPTETLHVFHDEMEWIIASSAEEALQILITTFGADSIDHEARTEFKMVPGDELVSVVCDARGAPSDHGKSVKQAAWQWVEQIGRGYLCSLDY